MSKPLLIIGNKNYSSWSLRPWLAMKVAGVDFDEKLIPLFEDDWAERKAEMPSGTVPILQHDGNVIWETMAILEYAAETWGLEKFWPADKAARARARSVANEMHAGFTNVRGNMPMNIRVHQPERGNKGDASVKSDIERIEKIWTDCRNTYGGGGSFLFGEFCNADAMFAPVVSRFTTYDVKLNAICQAYMDAVQALPAMKDWSDAGRAETWVIEQDEA